MGSAEKASACRGSGEKASAYRVCSFLPILAFLYTAMEDAVSNGRCRPSSSRDRKICSWVRAGGFLIFGGLRPG